MSKKNRSKDINDGLQKTNKNDKSIKVPQRDKLKQELDIFHRNDLTEKQKQYLDLILDKKTNIIFLKGPAGSSKSFLAIYAGLIALNSKTHSDILYIRAPIEVGKSIGFLPGEFDQKINNYLLPLQDKIDELLPRDQADLLVKEKRISGTVPNYLRGASWNAKYVIVDEAQNLTANELKTIITRAGRYTKLIFLADESQADIKGSIEFMRYFDLFNDEASREMGIYCLSFTKLDIVRSKILAYILDRIEGTYTPPF